MTQVSISGVIERDIDFLLIEELVASDGFLPWFLAKIGLSGTYEPVAVAHSTTTPNGETDIELTIRSASGTRLILIENKIDANLQPRQAERYRERAARYVAQGRCSAASTVLVAPAAYFASEADGLGFDHTVSYEDILDWFVHADRLGSRKEAKIALLQHALASGSDGWVMIPDESATVFWRRYWELYRSIAPELRMVKPEAKTAASRFVYFRPAGLPKGVQLIHKASYGHVDLQMAGMARAPNPPARSTRGSLSRG